MKRNEKEQTKGISLPYPRNQTTLKRKKRKKCPEKEKYSHVQAHMFALPKSHTASKSTFLPKTLSPVVHLPPKAHLIIFFCTFYHFIFPVIDIHYNAYENTGK
jgi:hypothetical protein